MEITKPLLPVESPTHRPHVGGRRRLRRLGQPRDQRVPRRQVRRHRRLPLPHRHEREGQSEPEAPLRHRTGPPQFQDLGESGPV
jgi:hypothetical protein